MTERQLIKLFPSNSYTQDKNNLKIFNFIQQHSILFVSNIQLAGISIHAGQEYQYLAGTNGTAQGEAAFFFLLDEITRRFSLSESTLTVGRRTGQEIYFPASRGSTNIVLLSMQANNGVMIMALRLMCMILSVFASHLYQNKIKGIVYENQYAGNQRGI